MIKIGGFLWNGYFLLLGNDGIRDSDSEPSIIKVIIDCILIRKVLLLIHKRSNKTHSL